MTFISRNDAFRERSRRIYAILVISHRTPRFNNMRIRILLIVAAVICLLNASSVNAQPTLGTYSYFWTNANDATNTPISTLNVAPGSTATVRFWLKETGGNALSSSNAFGLGGYDASFTWATGGTSGDANAQGIYITKVNGTNGATAANTDVQVNPFAYGSRGFNNSSDGLIPAGGTVAAINTAKSIQIAKTIGFTPDPANWVKATDGPNSTGNFLLTEMTFTTSAGFVGDTITGKQRGGTNYLYFLDGSGNASALDATIGSSASAVLTFTPVPEPTTILAISGSTYGLFMLRRRMRAKKNII